MKLFFCPICKDIQALRPTLRACECGRTEGAYVDERVVVVTGLGYVLGMRNDELLALAYGETTPGSDLTAFSLSDSSPSVVYQRVPHPLVPGDDETAVREAVDELVDRLTHAG